MVRRDQLFLTQDTLPIFDRLLDILDGIPGEVRSLVASPFFYAGLATRYESERLGIIVAGKDADGHGYRPSPAHPKA
jgi:hypothetical protein